MKIQQLLIGIFTWAFFACYSKTKEVDNKEQLDSFKSIGIAVKTTNSNKQAMTDMGELWSRFYFEDIISKIPNRINNDIYSIYTDYETDYTGSYTAIIGCKVTSVDSIPEGLTGREFSSGQYLKFIAKGKMPDAVINQWKAIWDRDKVLNRNYTADFEIYGQKSQDQNDAEIEIYIATD